MFLKKQKFFVAVLFCLVCIFFIGIPSDYAKRVEEKQFSGVNVFFGHSVETDTLELSNDIKRIDLLEILSQGNDGTNPGIQEAIDFLSGSAPTEKGLVVRLVNQNLLDEEISKDYASRVNSFAYTGLELNGHKFFQQEGFAPVNTRAWNRLGDELAGEELEALFAEAKSGGEVLVLDTAGTVSRLKNSFSILNLPEGLEGVFFTDASSYQSVNFAGDSLSQVVFTQSQDGAFALSKESDSDLAPKIHQLSL